jgi:hypothetical protein
MKTGLLIAAGIGILATGYFSFWSPDRVDYNTDVKPILNRKCMACHGGVKKAGGFSLLFQEEALGNTKSGHPAILPGDADHSEFILRLTDPDPDRRMPKKGNPLTEAEIQILRQWVEQGAEFEPHWAYQRIERPNVPGTDWRSWFSRDTWAKTDIDRFVAEVQTQYLASPASLTPNPEADRATLLRRVSLDLTGLPPTPAAYEAFKKDKSPNAYEKAVDRLLASPAYGEKWASMWLDLARYADSRGYEKDDLRSIWRYRDWVIRAFNQDMPYDQFLTEQLAGDLLVAQRKLSISTDSVARNLLIATGFHRNTLNNDEGGTDDEEWRIAEVMDRVNTNWVALSGTTFACVQCHSHPYDPFRHEEYYKQMAFFNNTQDADIGDDSPTLRFFNETDERKLNDLTRWIGQQVSPQKADETATFLRTFNDRIPFTEFDQIKNGLLFNSFTTFAKNGGSFRLPNAPIMGRRKLLVFTNTIYKPGGFITVYLDKLGGTKLGEIKLDTAKRTNLHVLTLPRITGRHHLFFEFRNPTYPPGSTADVGDIGWVAFRDDDLPGEGKPDYARYRQLFNDLFYAHTDKQPIMLENPASWRRTTKVFERGSFMAQTTPVQPDVPAALNPFPEGAPRNRLGLAQWLTARDNPLTARTAVNRFWEQLFGRGLVETLEDMGSQGFAPTHPELLDYLAYRFMVNYRWQIKPLLREIVLSGTYRQSSVASAAALAADPANTYLMRGPRVRLTGEQIRDEALSVSGLLSKTMYGKPVMPYQPAGLWQTVYSGHKWVTSTGDDAYRRAIYTMLRRSSPYPNMTTFDGTSREVCQARRIRTNTPLQALAMLNDSAYVEMAQHFALRMQREGGPTLAGQLQRGYYVMMGQPLPPKKQAALTALYDKALVRYRQHPDRLRDWVGDRKPETAALAIVANTMLNMDEFIVNQ